MLSHFIEIASFSTIFLLDSGLAGMGELVTLFFLSFVKFALAALGAIARPELSFWNIIISVGGGALVSVVFYTYFGNIIRAWIKARFKGRKPTSFKRRRQTYNFWKKYGLAGTAFLAPILSPMLSVAIAIAFKEEPKRIILFVGISIVCWTLVFAFFREGVLEIIASFQAS